ncbi:putative nucleotide-binding protein [Bradyrhizobium sp. I1.8.5]|uniref:nucleotide-binding protein n=1 Tax=Bradyrhizobium sp. I1.8.5 TaxID=3156365 RepID=UPI00339356D3
MPPRKPAKPESRNLNDAEKRSAVPRLEARIKEIDELDVSTIMTGDDPPIAQIEQRIRSTLANIYGGDTAEYNRLHGATSLDATTYYLSMGMDNSGPSVSEIRQGVEKGRQRAKAILQGEVDSLKEYLEYSAPVDVRTESATIDLPLSDEVFIVHGRDEAAKEAVARLIQRAGLKPVILHEQPNGGKTIIEKFEKHGSAAGFAVVIASPDDVGGLAVPPGTEPQLNPRARQNVIGEMFWFAGRLGRNKVCALVKGSIEMPSDFAGVVYTPMDEHGGWRAKLLNELAAAGHKEINWQAALS